MQLVSSGGTAATLREAGIEVTEVADLTGFPEMLGGRVKTLHPAIHGGLLADQRDPDHLAQIAEQGIEPFDLLVSNLYPFRETVAAGASLEDSIEKIDIGGPAMVRAGAKNFESVAVVVNPDRYETVLEELQLEGGLTRATRFALAAEAFAHTAAYDAAVGGWFAQQETDGDALPGFVGLALREGRGPALRREPAPARRAVRGRGRARCLRRRPGAAGQGDVVQQLARCVGARYDLAIALPRARMRHREAQQPLRRGGAGARRRRPTAARSRATRSAPSAGSSRSTAPCDEAAAEAMREVFTEVVIAPAFTDGAREAFAPGRTSAWCGRR